MIALIVTALLGQVSPCPEAAKEPLTSAAARVAEFDMSAAIADLVSIAATCRDADVARFYLQGLIAAREAYRYGGSPESLVPVRTAIAALAEHAPESVPAEIARVVLLAASAAAQSEREEMGLFLEQARRLEQQLGSSGGRGAPLVSAHEIAGDLWLQVHRFDEARAAYLEAVEQIGPTRRISLGLARTASWLKETATACDHYRALITGWPPSAGMPAELTEARAFLRRPECRAAAPSRSR